jgi:tetratricopeptide (TPR) repeat protein
MADAASISDVLKSIPEIVKIIPDQDKLAALTVVALLVIVLVLFQSGLLSFASPSTRNYVIKFIVRYMFVLTGLVIVTTFSNTVFDKLTEIAEISAKLNKMSVTTASPGAPIVPPDQTRDLVNALVILSGRLHPPPGIDEAIAQLKAGNTKPAIEILEKYVLVQETENAARAATLRRIGLLNFFNDTAASLAAYRQSVELDPTSWEAWGQIAILLERTGDHEGAAAAANKVLQIGKEKQDQKTLGVGYGALAYIEANAGRKDNARPLLEKSRGNFLAAGSKLEYAAATNNLARLEFSEGNFEEAIRYYEEALATDTAIDNQRGVASDYSGLAEVYFELEEDSSHYDKALEYYEKSIAANQSIGDPHQAAMALSGKCNIYLERREVGDLEKAKEDCTGRSPWNRRSKTSVPRSSSWASWRALHGLAAISTAPKQSTVRRSTLRKSSNLRFLKPRSNATSVNFILTRTSLCRRSIRFAVPPTSIKA